MYREHGVAFEGAAERETDMTQNAAIRAGDAPAIGELLASVNTEFIQEGCDGLEYA
jgi:hypothetical protein